MSLASRLDRHADLVHGMADTLNIDLAEKAMRGEMAEGDFRNIVMSCLACDKPDECRQFLDTHKSGADEAPAYCRNHDKFARLKAG